MNFCNKRGVGYIGLQSLLSRGYSAVGMSWHVPAGGRREGSATRERRGSGREKERAGKPVKPHSSHLKRETVPCIKMSNVKIPVGSVSSYSRKFHEVTLIFTVCCILLRWFVSAVSQRISSNVEVSVYAYREFNTDKWFYWYRGSKPWSYVNRTKLKQWHNPHAKRSTDLRINSHVWIMWCQHEQRS